MFISGVLCHVPDEETGWVGKGWVQVAGVWASGLKGLSKPSTALHMREAHMHPYVYF